MQSAEPVVHACESRKLSNTKYCVWQFRVEIGGPNAGVLAGTSTPINPALNVAIC